MSRQEILAIYEGVRNQSRASQKSVHGELPQDQTRTQSSELSLHTQVEQAVLEFCLDLLTVIPEPSATEVALARLMPDVVADLQTLQLLRILHATEIFLNQEYQKMYGQFATIQKPEADIFQQENEQYWALYNSMSALRNQMQVVANLRDKLLRQQPVVVSEVVAVADEVLNGQKNE
jgi:hypothetical protein